MRKSIILFIAFFAAASLGAQTVPVKLARAWRGFENDSQMRAAIASIYIVDAETGNIVFAKNERTGMAPASTQKVITAATAYEVLGAQFRYETVLAYRDTIINGNLQGPLQIIGSGDPSLGSWRWKSTTGLTARFASAVKEKGIRSYGAIQTPEEGWETEIIPPGWIWEDLGQYYGVGAGKLNWHENQFDLLLKSGARIGDPVSISGSEPFVNDSMVSFVTSAAPGTGDQTYLYPANNGRPVSIRGTIPIDQDRFRVAGSMAAPHQKLAQALDLELARGGVLSTNKISQSGAGAHAAIEIYREQSPILDSLVFWFLKKSINLYGEAFLKTMALRATGIASTNTGTKWMRSFWQDHGINPIELNFKDGSGLSPENRVTTHAQVVVLQYARRQPWFSGYRKAFPEFNGMTMKGGTISGVKAFCGYHRSAAGKEYVFSFIVNNYNGAERLIIQKMYEVLNELK